jgi:4-carboxymuconolactone decarboxylase
MSEKSKGNEVLRERRAAGRRMRIEVYGEEFVKATDAKADGFLKAYYDAADEFCYGTIWTRPKLPARTRSLIALAITAAKSQTHAVKQQVRAALRAGWTREQIGEVLLHVYCYAGCYSSLEAFVAAKETFDEIDLAEKGSTVPVVMAAEPAEIEIEDATAAWSSRGNQRTTALAERGLQIRRETLGREHIDESMEQTVEDPFMMMFMDVTHEYCFGTLWARPGIERKLRSILSLAISASQNQTGAIKRHVRSCVQAGWSKEEIGEIFLQVYVYSGVYACFGSFIAANEVFAKMAREGHHIKAKASDTEFSS